jgi:hypothetical protein
MITKRWLVSPEVAGELGTNTVIDTSVHPPRVSRLHHQFEGWLGDDLLEVFPCFLVSSRLAQALDSAALVGFELAEAEVSKSPEFEDMYPGRVLPEFLWLKITGSGPEADLRLSADFRLEVSQRALEVLRTFNLTNALVEHAHMDPARS